ncbi:helix-turn-helix domain-containing protein [Mariniflexile sp. HNIBRBA6329]|uniref:helix-turn-helix domain-containing protein n=1 Tax=Mariniflexile sp. HNIBRBA6329 TaxID=3373088 RepID=UPI0037458476
MSDYGKITNFILVFLFLVTYIAVIFNILRKNIWFKKDLLISDTHFKLVRNWTVYLFSINVLAVLIILISVYTEANKDLLLSGKSLATFSLLFWLFIYFKILTTPEILYGLPILNKKILKFGITEQETEEVSTLKSNNWVLEVSDQKNDQDLKLQEKIISNIDSYIQEVEKICIEEHIFRNPKASPTDIANKLGVPTSHIVYLFKYHSKISFSEYRMHSRIMDSINLIEQGYLKTNTLESLAYKTGFASYNPFFSAFKKVTNYSPQDYLKTYRSAV